MVVGVINKTILKKSCNFVMIEINYLINIIYLITNR